MNTENETNGEVKCLYPGCAKSTKLAGGGRGLCGCHYQRARSLVKKGQVTWEQLEVAGKAVSKEGSKGKEQNAWFLEGVK